jgi:hypothetical protein
MRSVHERVARGLDELRVSTLLLAKNAMQCQFTRVSCDMAIGWVKSDSGILRITCWAERSKEPAKTLESN